MIKRRKSIFFIDSNFSMPYLFIFVALYCEKKDIMIMQYIVEKHTTLEAVLFFSLSIRVLV